MPRLMPSPRGPQPRGRLSRFERIVLGLCGPFSLIAPWVPRAWADDSPIVEARSEAAAEHPLEVRYLRRVTTEEGTGLLAGYADAEVESGVYTIDRAPGERAAGDGESEREGDELLSLHVERTIRSQGRDVCASRQEAASAEIALATRRYRGASELSGSADAGEGTWIWAPPDTPRGSTLDVLGRELRVERGLMIDVGNSTIPVFVAEASEERTREAPAGFAGEAGSFRAQSSLSVYFDERTGYALRMERWEIAENARASFEERELLTVAEAPFLPERATSAWVEVGPCRSPGDAPEIRWWYFVASGSIVVFVFGGLLGLRRRHAGGWQ